MPAQRDIFLQRNEDLDEYWSVTDDVGVPLDLTGCTVAMQARDKLGGTLVASATIDGTDLPIGGFGVLLTGASFAAFGDPIQPQNIPYDCRLTYPDGVFRVLVAGTIVLSRGETQA